MKQLKKTTKTNEGVKVHYFMFLNNVPVAWRCDDWFSARCSKLGMLFYKLPLLNSSTTFSLSLSVLSSLCCLLKKNPTEIQNSCISTDSNLHTVAVYDLHLILFRGI